MITIEQVKIHFKYRYPEVEVYETAKNTIGIRSSKCWYNTIEFINFPYFCGGIYLCNLHTENITYVESLLELCRNRKLGLVNYISTVEQFSINNELITLGFKEIYRFINPNTSYECIQWNLNLTEKYEEKILD